MKPFDDLSESEKNRLANWLVSEIATQGRIQSMDNRELLWWFMQSDEYASFSMVGFFSALIDEIENRLYPEYDGENVVSTEWGWKTPEGPIVYVKEDAP